METHALIAGTLGLEVQDRLVVLGSKNMERLFCTWSPRQQGRSHHPTLSEPSLRPPTSPGPSADRYAPLTGVFSCLNRPGVSTSRSEKTRFEEKCHNLSVTRERPFVER